MCGMEGAFDRLFVVSADSISRGHAIMWGSETMLILSFIVQDIPPFVFIFVG